MAPKNQRKTRLAYVQSFKKKNAIYSSDSMSTSLPMRAYP